MVSIAVYLLNKEVHIHSVLVIWLVKHQLSVFTTYLPIYPSTSHIPLPQPFYISTIISIGSTGWGKSWSGNSGPQQGKYLRESPADSKHSPPPLLCPLVHKTCSPKYLFQFVAPARYLNVSACANESRKSKMTPFVQLGSNAKPRVASRLCPCFANMARPGGRVFEGILRQTTANVPPPLWD